MEMARRVKSKGKAAKSAVTAESTLSTMKADAQSLRNEAQSARQVAHLRRIKIQSAASDWWGKKCHGESLLKENCHAMSDPDLAIAEQFLDIASQRIDSLHLEAKEAQLEVDRLDDTVNGLWAVIQDIDGASRRVNVRRVLESTARGLNTEVTRSTLSDARVQEIQDQIRKAAAFTRGLTEIITEEIKR